MHPAHHSSLLPEIFRNNEFKIRLFKPQCLLLDFHGTLSERRWEDQVIFPYVRRSVKNYIKDNWANEIVQKCIPGLKIESFEQRFRNKYDDAPVIDDYNESQDVNPSRLAEQLGDFLTWQMINNRGTRETQTISRLVWLDGYMKKQITTPIFDDVMPRVKVWFEEYHLSIYVISSIDEKTLKFLFEHTNKGDLNKYLAGYIGAKKIGDKLISDTYQQFYLRHLSIRDKHHEPMSNNGRNKSPRARSPRNENSGSSGNKNGLSPQSPSTRSPGYGAIARPILFVTDSGQEAKAASQVGDGLAFECVLINRPGNKRIRSYYLSQFQFVNRFDEIEFV